MKLRLDINTALPTLDVSLYNKDLTKVQETCTVAQGDYEKRISANPVFLKNSIFPAAVRYVDFEQGIVLFERPPCYVQFNFSCQAQSNLASDKRSAFCLNLPIPWQQYVLFLGPNGVANRIYVFFANKQIQSLTDDSLSMPPLPNLYEDASVCLPLFDHIEVENLDLISAISNAYNIVWKSGFNMDVIKGLQSWFLRANRELNLLAALAKPLHSLETFYKYWASFSLEKIVSFSWLAPLYSSFNHLISNQFHPSPELHDRVVDLYLAARS